MYCVDISYLTNRIFASNVQFRAGSSIRGEGGTTHPAAELIAHPQYDAYTTDFDVAVVRVSDNVCAKVHIKKKHFKLDTNTINNRENLVNNLKILQLTAGLTLRNTTNRN